MNIPSDGSRQVQSAFREVYETIRPLRGRSVWDLEGRRVTGAGDARDPTDLLTLRQARQEFGFEAFYERLRQRGLDGFSGVLKEPQKARVSAPDSTAPPRHTEQSFFYEPDTGRWRFADGTQLITISATGDALPEAGTGDLLRSDGTTELTGDRIVRADWTYNRASATPSESRRLTLRRSRGTSASPQDLLAGDRLGNIPYDGYLAGWQSIVEMVGSVRDVGVSFLSGRWRVDTQDSTIGSLSTRLQVDETEMRVFVPLVATQPITATAAANTISGDNTVIGGSVATTHRLDIQGSNAQTLTQWTNLSNSNRQLMRFTTVSNGIRILGYDSTPAVMFEIRGAGGNAWFGDGSGASVGIGFFADQDTGIRRVGTDHGALVAGTLDVFEWDETSGSPRLGFYGTSPVSRPSGWTTFTNLSTDRTCDANATTVEELADILGTLIEDLKGTGLLEV